MLFVVEQPYLFPATVFFTFFAATMTLLATTAAYVAAGAMIVAMPSLGPFHLCAIHQTTSMATETTISFRRNTIGENGPPNCSTIGLASIPRSVLTAICVDTTSARLREQSWCWSASISDLKLYVLDQFEADTESFLPFS